MFLRLGAWNQGFGRTVCPLKSREAAGGGGEPSLSAQLPGAPGFSWFVAAFFQSMLASSHVVFPWTLFVSRFSSYRNFTHIGLGSNLVAQTAKNLPASQEMWVRSLGWKGPPETGMPTHCSILAWRIPWTEEPGGIQSMGSDTTEQLILPPYDCFIHR